MWREYTSETRMIFLILAVSLAAITVSGSAGASEKPEKHWIIPDHVKSQYAGNMGFLSLGFGYSIFGDRLQSDLFYGYSPKSRSGVTVHQITQKNTYLPYTLALSSRWQWTPVTTGMHFLFKVGNNNGGIWLIQPGRFPDPYYHPTALHILLIMGTHFDFLSRNGIPRAGIYFEAGTTAGYLENWLREDYVKLSDIVSFDFGVIRRF